MKVTVVGSGPNGLAAAVIMARAGHEVHVIEKQDHAGGGLRTTSFDGGQGLLDICSAVHPMAVSSAFFMAFGLARRIEFRTPEISFAHALQGRSAVAYHDLARTVDELGRDGAQWRRALEPLVERIGVIRGLSGLSLDARARNLRGILELGTTAGIRFPAMTGAARALAAGATAHGAAALSSLPGRFVGAVLAAEAHASGWPIPTGGSQRIADALVDDLELHGGRVTTGREVTDLREIWRPGEVAFLDTSPRAAAVMTGDLLPSRFRRALGRYRYGSAASKVDFVLSSPIPWSDSRLRDAVTVHLGGSARDVFAAETSARRGTMPSRPFVLVSQPTRIDRTRLPDNSPREIVWSYAHVPNGSDLDATEVITQRIEAFAPGFRDTIVHSESRSARWYEEYNPNYVGGDVLGGRLDLAQFITRPTVSVSPWKTPARGVYLCSASTAPGAGVHGMGGWHAARLALSELAGQGLPDLSE